MTLVLLVSLVLVSETPVAEPDGDETADGEPPLERVHLMGGRLDLLMRYGLSSPRPPRETALDPPPLYTSSSPRDPWLAYDKLQHVTFGLLGTLSAQYVLTEKAGATPSTALGVSTGTAAAVSVGKELYDRRAGRFFSFRDLVADTLGIGLAAGIILL